MSSRERWQRIDAILDGVLDLEPAARRARLADLCGGDDELRQEVDELLAAHVDSAAFMAAPAIECAAPLVAAVERDLGGSSDQLIGRIVGRYRLLRQLGEGGMGIVYLAERIDGQVKLAKQGLHGEDARRRFLQERQILARLEHPAIARLLDAGVTDEGTPFFVMERVEGQPVTSYCSAHALPVEARLRLFLEICGAVQYAHRNLIVHRDLKPSNILVDDDARAKLLDFGIAKLIGCPEAASDAPPTIVRALTPDYAAPEQLCGEPATASTDVYSLGVLLYELLTESRPYRLTSGAIGEIERAILEQIPAPPSARVASTADRRRLKGDLDRVVLKALQKSPDRRYQSAEALALDVRRHLDGLPVSAQGDALSYRARKFLGRHRVGVGAAALLGVTLVGGLIATSWEARRAAREARKADTVKEFLKTILISANPDVANGRVMSAREFLDAGARRVETELGDQPDVQSEVARVIADAYQALGEYDRVTALLSADLERRRRSEGAQSVAVAELLRQIADALYEQSRYERSGQMYEQALAIMRERRGERSPQVAELLWDLSGVKRNQGDLARAEALQKQALAIDIAIGGDDSGEAMAVRESLAITYLQAGRFSEAAALVEPVASWREQHLGPDHPSTLVAWYNVAYELHARGRFDEALRRIEDVIARQRRVIGNRHNRVSASLRLRARVLDGSGRADAALQPMTEALGITIERFGADNLQVAHDRTWLALVEAHIGRLADAVRDAREALRIFAAQPGPCGSASFSPTPACWTKATRLSPARSPTCAARTARGCFSGWRSTRLATSRVGTGRRRALSDSRARRCRSSNMASRVPILPSRWRGRTPGPPSGQPVTAQPANA